MVTNLRHRVQKEVTKSLPFAQSSKFKSICSRNDFIRQIQSELIRSRDIRRQIHIKFEHDLFERLFIIFIECQSRSDTREPMRRASDVRVRVRSQVSAGCDGSIDFAFGYKCGFEQCDGSANGWAVRLFIPRLLFAVSEKRIIEHQLIYFCRLAADYFSVWIAVLCSAVGGARVCACEAGTSPV